MISQQIWHIPRIRFATSIEDVKIVQVQDSNYDVDNIDFIRVYDFACIKNIKGFYLLLKNKKF